MAEQRSIIWVLGSCLTACLLISCSSGIGAGESCQKDGDECEEGLRCIAKSSGERECREPLVPSDDSGICEIKEDCALDGTDCASGHCGWTGVGYSCARDIECQGDNVCRKVNDHKECAPQGQACEPCDTDSDCAKDETLPGICQSGVCIQSIDTKCVSDACCATGQFCYKNVADTSAPTTCAYPQTAADTPCDIDAHCAAGLVCKSGKCTDATM